MNECVLPGYREHTRAGQCFQKRSERSCPLRRTAGVPDAAHVRDDKPDDTQTQKLCIGVAVYVLCHITVCTELKSC